VRALTPFEQAGAAAARLDALADAALAAHLHGLHAGFLAAVARRLGRRLTALLAVRRLLRRHTVLFLHALAGLLEQHGFQRSPQHGDAAAHLLPAVLAHGAAAPVAHAIVFREAAARVGLSLAVAALDGGTFCVAWLEAAAGEPLAGIMQLDGHKHARTSACVVQSDALLSGNTRVRPWDF
jgi:Transglutaminase-like superfamily